MFQPEESYSLPRLTAVYSTSEWNLVGRLFRGEASEYSLATEYPPYSHRDIDMLNHFFPGAKRILRIPPQQLFSMAFDYLSDSSKHILCKPGSASPVLGALLLTALHPRCTEYFYDPEWARFGDNYLRHFYALLRRTIYDYQSSDLPAMLSALEGNGPLSEQCPPLVKAVRAWRRLCEDIACSENRPLPRCLPRTNVYEPMDKPVELNFPLESGVASMHELITCLLVFNPATLSTVYTERTSNAPTGRYQLSYEDPALEDHFRCAMLENGEFDYDRIVPGIDIDQLNALLKQGFLTEYRTEIFKKRPAFPATNGRRHPFSDSAK